MENLRILGIEASAKVAGAAIYENGMIIAQESLNGALTHSETLMPMIDHLFQSAGITPDSIQAIALSAGPGSFTGLRIGAATAKGLAAGLNVPLIPLSTLEAIAYECCVAALPGSNLLIVPMMDARRSQVYTAVYESANADETAPLHNLLAPDAMSPDALSEFLKEQDRPALLLGDGAALYYSKLKAQGCTVHLAPAHLISASPAAVATLGAFYYEAGKTVEGSALEIEYLRKPQAEREREERLQAEAAKNSVKNL